MQARTNISYLSICFLDIIILRVSKLYNFAPLCYAYFISITKRLEMNTSQANENMIYIRICKQRIIKQIITLSSKIIVKLTRLCAFAIRFFFLKIV